MSANIDYEFNSERSFSEPGNDSESIKWKKDAVIQGRTSRICRPCGSTLNMVRFCDWCRSQSNGTVVSAGLCMMLRIVIWLIRSL